MHERWFSSDTRTDRPSESLLVYPPAADTLRLRTAALGLGVAGFSLATAQPRRQSGWWRQVEQHRRGWQAAAAPRTG